MPDYQLYLHDGPDTPPTSETVDASDHVEAVALAEMRLLLTKTYTHAILSFKGETVASLARDSQSPLDDLAANS